MGRVEGKVALVTGGAVGIGAATARLLAREGANVAITDVKTDEGEALARQLGDDALFVRHDVSSEQDWRHAIDATLARFGRLDVLVNNAGVGVAANVEVETLENWRWLMSINLDGVFLGTKLAIESMKRSASAGSIINLSSIEGIVADANLAAYNASKGGVTLFTKSAALHCAKTGTRIRVNSVHPGYIWTPMVQNHLNRQPDPEAAKAYVESLHPVGHLGEPDDIAYAILYLASDESKFVTGAELVVDGGYTAQ